MRVLVACEESQAVCTEFRERGHESYSCDIQPCSGGHPEWHIQADATELIKLRWDLIIAHPPCTDLAVSGAAWFEQKRKVDLTNLLEAADDLLVLAGVLADDNSKIIVSHDGSRVLLDREKPRTEIFVEHVGGEADGALRRH